MIARLLAAALCCAAITVAQPAFEVASIKPSAPDQPGMGMSSERGRLILHNATLKFCIQAAYQLQDFELSGGPKWMDSDRYDIEGKPAAAANFDQLIQMLRTLLADRFQLQFHREAKMAPGYALAVGKDGPKLQKPEVEGRPGLGMGRGMVNGRYQTMSGLAEALSRVLGRPVADETRVTDRFDFRLTWTPGDTEPMMQKPGLAPGEPAPLDSVVGPSVFAAIQEQLGLKLEARRVPVDVMVIDRAEKPTEN